MLMIIFIVMLILSCSFPSSLIKNNVANSSKILNNEGNIVIDAGTERENILVKQ